MLLLAVHWASFPLLFFIFLSPSFSPFRGTRTMAPTPNRGPEAVRTGIHLLMAFTGLGRLLACVTPSRPRLPSSNTTARARNRGTRCRKRVNTLTASERAHVPTYNKTKRKQSIAYSFPHTSFFLLLSLFLLPSPSPLHSQTRRFRCD